MGITPAYAGNTLTALLFFFSFEDHPRIRGEHVLRLHLILLNLGSPPLTRGTPKNKLVKRYTLGITPAYAGNTCIFGSKYH